MKLALSKLFLFLFLLPLGGCGLENLVTVTVTTTHCDGVPLEVPTIHKLRGTWTVFGGITASLRDVETGEVCILAAGGPGMPNGGRYECTHPSNPGVSTGEGRVMMDPGSTTKGTWQDTGPSKPLYSGTFCVD